MMGWSSRKGASPDPGRGQAHSSLVSQLQRSGPGRAARVAEARPGPPLTISPLPWCRAQRSAMYTARFESRLVFGVEQTGATRRAPPRIQFFTSFFGE